MNTLEKPSSKQVLATALNSVKAHLDLTSQDIATIIGSSETSVNRYFRQGEIGPSPKEQELVLLLIRIYRSLFALNGGNLRAMKHWLNTDNRHLDAIPVEAMKSVTGIVNVVRYLDAIRGKV